MAASLQAQNTEALYAFSRSIAASPNRDELAEAAASRLSDLLDRDILLLLLTVKGMLQVAGCFEPRATRSRTSNSTRFERPGPLASGRTGTRCGSAPRLFYPLRAGSDR